ncbi:MAG: MBOAT family protein [Candidatus Abyssobacteria bacterium SURF_5]|uniref:MBOAT family protein n=1 Tax=Abyssobacteria bacterium (strain SURF_5) TaxID=2093360 RepID=A0A3A4N9K0_ABYX5|nr:MAG: MBOAT family protein [Candidatus Abyssubacteria bacterium SURF_5]
MLFNSLAFGGFLIIALILFWSAPRTHRVFIIIGLSYFFYMYSYPIYFFLLAILTLINFGLALEMARKPSRRKHFLALAISIDLFVLGFYKYAGFASREVLNLLSSFGIQSDVTAIEITLPLGISFFTFQMMSYVIDTYRGLPAEKSFWNFAAYISFFPQLVAGPIVRPQTLLPQIKADHKYDEDQAVRGLFLIAQGLVKKVAFADFLGGYVDKVFAAPGDFSGLATLIGIYAYAFQIYFDFSGYTDIAIGVGKLFSFEIPINFDLPYISKSPREFWRRWHISLSTWLRDYLYIPLGGNRKSSGRTYYNMMVTMLLGGIWHGANWTFLFWGAYHGLLISIQRLLEENLPAAKRWIEKPSPLVAVGSALLTFHLVSLGWVIFRAQSLGQAVEVLKNVFSGGQGVETFETPIVVMLSIAILSHIFRSRVKLEEWYVRMPAPVQAFGYSCVTILIYLFFTTEQRFIYFQF